MPNFLQDIVDSIARDKLFHLAAGVITILSMALLLFVAQRFGALPAIALATTLMGAGLEGYQWIRKEGEVAYADALATASPGWALWAGVELWRMWRELPVVMLTS